MTLPMIVLSLGCIGVGLFPMIATVPLDNAVQIWASLPTQTVSITTAAPLRWITIMGLAFAAIVGIIILAVKKWVRTNVISRTGTWDCGYARPTARIQYTGSSFGQILVNLFTFVLWPKTDWPAMRSPFPDAAHFKSVVPDTVLDRLIVPLFRIADKYLPMFRFLQQGQTHLYVLYILVIVIILLIFGGIGVER